MTDNILQHLRSVANDEYQTATTIARALNILPVDASRALQKLELRGKVVCRRAGVVLTWKARTR